MPNWCLNTVELTSTKEDIDALLIYLVEHNGEEWFNFFTGSVMRRGRRLVF
jgi:hypothetical protein